MPDHTRALKQHKDILTKLQLSKNLNSHKILSSEFLKQYKQSGDAQFRSIIHSFLMTVDTNSKHSSLYTTQYAKEYTTLAKQIDGSAWYPLALAPQTEHSARKNRYTDIFPYELTRVRMHRDTPSLETDNYIDASHIFPNYIACSSPVLLAISDFWNMVWQQNVRVILMLTKWKERGRIKADMYWDTCVQEFDGVFVELDNEESCDKDSVCVIRMFSLYRREDKADRRTIRHVQFASWPDHGVPQDFTHITRTLDIVHRLQIEENSQDFPLLVHCSAGVGRSGTWIAIDIILQRTCTAIQNKSEEKLKDALNVYKTVYALRCQRPRMVQTLQQYEFIYRYVAAVLSDQERW